MPASTEYRPSSFATDVDFFKAGKLADSVFICTMDQQHEEQTMKALELGYHVFLEKPIAVTEEGSRKVVREANRCQRVLNIGLVLRYSPLFATVKSVIDAGALGDLVSMRMSENMGTWVFAHSFVRGNWGNIARSSHMIVQKGCHDFDILCYLVGSRPELLSCTTSPPALPKEKMPPGCAGALHRRLPACRHLPVRRRPLLSGRHPHDAQHCAFRQYLRQRHFPRGDALSPPGEAP